MKNKSGVLLVVLIIVVGSVWMLFSKGLMRPKPKFEFQKGMCYVTWSKDRYGSAASDESLEAMAATGTKWVAIVTTWFQESCSTTKIFPTDYTPTDDSIIHAVEKAHSLGMKVMLKPHLDLQDTSGGSWRGEIVCTSESGWNEWFESYRGFIVHYAKMAQEHKVELLCIGTELTSVATVKEDMWKSKVIAPVREAYKGPLTYAANWNEEFEHVKFWDALDYVGIDPYFPLSDKARPTLAEIKKGWGEWLAQIEAFQATVNKPVIFPEAGYCSATGAARMPWEESMGKLDLDLQADCYTALLETFWNKEWFYGVYWWKWGTDVRFGGPNNRGYSPQNKPAEKIVKEWYAKSIGPKTNFETTGK
ncbi:MAG: glycoside hydrolase TIM-barrel-like domain-containing protein [Candidatus Omnitrophica bacterium]|nr:glycoside hydrolase TIM-barrel-like domain-containing protein [Candidatus Omnitrophota bacterium]